MAVVIGIPIKPFDAAKQRLAGVLSVPDRRRLSIALAHRTLRMVVEAGAAPLVLAADEEVRLWAERKGVPVLADRGLGLDAAARLAVEWAAGQRMAWIICPSDLPLLAADDLRAALAAIEAGRPVLAPSTDGGTSLIGAVSDTFDFGYGPASFHRHLARLASSAPIILTALGLMLDLDEPADIKAASIHDRGRWLIPYLPPSVASPR